MASSSTLPLGTIAPPFALPDVRTGRPLTLDELAGPAGTLIVFTCNHCPYVKHLRDGIAAYARDYLPRGIAMIGIASNDPQKVPEDAPDRIAAEADRTGWTFPHLFDELQLVAHAYQAACTPELYLFDARARRLVYHGRFDASRPGQPTPVTGDELRAATDALLSGRTPAPGITAIGCGIKWTLPPADR